MSNDVIINVKVNNNTSGADQVKDSLRGIGESATVAGEKIARGMDRARDSLGRFVKEGERGSSTVGRKLSEIEGITGKLSQVAGAFGQSFIKGLSGPAEAASDFITKMGQVGITTAASGAAGTAASGGLNLLVGALVSVASAIPAILGGFVALAPALLAAGGAAGAAATMFAGAGIALATLKIGFGGIGAALSAHGKSMGGAGKAATDTGEQNYQAAKRIKDASRAVVDAQRAVVDAQKAVVAAKGDEKKAAQDVNRARADEVDRIRELDLALRGQKISQAEAAQALVEAKEKARRAEIAGSDWEKAEARNAVARAQLQYDEVGEKLGDLTAEKKKADKQGVEGSDQVQAALSRQKEAHQQVIAAQQRVTDATTRVTRAQEALADAHHKVATASTAAGGGINAFDEAMKKLSPNAQKLVYALIDIEKRFAAIKRRVQDRLLDGFDVAVTELADKWLPHLDDILGKMADHLNHFGKTLMTALGDSEFIKNIERAGDAFGDFVDQIGRASADIIDAFGRIAGHSGPVLHEIGAMIENIANKFDEWIKAADRTGALDSFMTAAAATLHDIFDITGLVFTIIGQLIKILFPGSQAASDSIFDKVRDALQRVSNWLGDPKNQKKVKDFVDQVVTFLKWLVSVGIPAVMRFAGWIGQIAYSAVNTGRAVRNMWESIKNGATNAWNWVVSKTATVFNWIMRSASIVGSNLSGMWEGLKNGFRGAVNWIIARWNNLSFTIGGGSFLGMSIPQGRVDTPNIPYLARGGIAGGLAMVGERGRELVRLPQGSTVIPNGQTESMMSQGGGGGTKIMLGFDTSSSNKLADAINETIRAYVFTRGGSVQKAYGRAGVA